MRRRFKVKVDDETFIVEVEEITETGTVETIPDTHARAKHVVAVPRPVERKGDATRGVVTAPLPGVISAIKRSVGDRVEVGNVLLVLEAMKMENEIFAPISGVVREIYINLGKQVGRGDKLMFIS